MLQRSAFFKNDDESLFFYDSYVNKILTSHHSEKLSAAMWIPFITFYAKKDPKMCVGYS
jgi:hypothetical protein